MYVYMYDYLEIYTHQQLQEKIYMYPKISIENSGEARNSFF